MAKGKVSKNSRTSKTTVNVFTKPVKPKKETIMIEVTKEVRAELEKDSEAYRGRLIEKIIKRYGKEYLQISNT